MNDLERAVIEAARLYVKDHADVGRMNAIFDAVDALNEHERAMAEAGVREIGWHLVAVGDEVQGRSGTFYLVVGTAQVGEVYKIRIRMAQGDRTINRPSESQPMATVKRGQDGKAVDTFVNVFSSGNAE